MRALSPHPSWGLPHFRPLSGNSSTARATDFLGVLPSKATPLFWGRTELHLSGGVSLNKSCWPGHCSHTNLCSQTPVISTTMSPRSPTIPSNPDLRWGWHTNHIHVNTSIPLSFTWPVLLWVLRAGDSVTHTQHEVQHTLATPSSAGFNNLHWHHRLGFFCCYYFVYLFSLRRQHREIRSVCSKTWGFCVIVSIGAAWG